MTAAPHDALFKATFSQVEQAVEELRHVLPATLLARMDLASLAVEAGSFVDESRRGLARADPLRGAVRPASRGRRVHAALSLRARRPRRAERDGAGRADRLGIHPPGASALQQSRSERDLGQLLRGWSGLIREVQRATGGARALRLVIRYLFEVCGAAELAAVDTTASEIDPGNEDVMETIAQMLESRGMQRGLQQGLQEGRQEGRQEGQRELLLRLLRRRFGELPAQAEQRVAAAEGPALERWAEQLLLAGCLDDVFGEP